MVQEAKPDPQVFTLGAELVGIPYEDCAVFEDSQAGIEAANRAGMYSIGVSRAGVLQGCKEQIADLSLIGETSWYQKNFIVVIRRGSKQCMISKLQKQIL